jgi:hypothetical protein
MGGAVPQSPPIGTFKPGGEDAVKEWIDDDRIANGIKPRYRPLAAAFDTPPVLRANANAPATPADPDPNNLLEYGQNFGYAGDGGGGALAQTAQAQSERDETASTEGVAAQFAQAQAGQPQRRQPANNAPAPAAPRRGPIPSQAPLTRYDEAIGSHDRTPVPPLTTIGRNDRPTEDDQARHEVFVRAARQLQGAGPRVQETLRHLWQTEGGDRIDPRPTAASSGITQRTYDLVVVAGGRVADLQGIRTPGDIPTDRRSEVMRDALDQMLARAGGTAELERFDDQNVANAIASTVYYVGPTDGGTAIREALRTTVGENLPPEMEKLPRSGALRKEVIDELLPVLADPARRDAFMENLANARVPHLARQLGKSPEQLTEGELDAINGYRPSRQGR